MPAGLRWFAEYQPFTPIIETLRGLLLGTPIGDDADRRRGLVRRHRLGRLPLGEEAVRPPALTVMTAQRPRRGGPPLVRRGTFRELEHLMDLACEFPERPRDLLR